LHEAFFMDVESIRGASLKNSVVWINSWGLPKSKETKKLSADMESIHPCRQQAILHFPLHALLFSCYSVTNKCKHFV